MKTRNPARCAERISFAKGPGTLIAVDSGARKAGVALLQWEDSPGNAQVVAAATVEVVEDSDLPNTVHAWGASRVELEPVYWVVEVPKKYLHGQRYHKNLDRLLRFVNHFPATWSGQFLPSEWKGNVGSTLRNTKHIYHQRMVRALSPEESRLAHYLGPDALDAVGIGLYVVGRIGRGGLLCPVK